MFTPTKEAEMSNRIIFKITRNRRKIRASLKKIVCLSLIFLLLISFLNLNINTTNFIKNNEYINQDETSLLNNLKTAVDPSIVKPPYINNFNDTYSFFTSKYGSNYDNTIYYRYGDEDGDITSYDVFSLDNLLFLKTMEKIQQSLSPSETTSQYDQLKSTPLWFDNGTHYGFMRSINGSAGGILDGNRYLIDNLMPIILLIDNYESSSRIIEMFTLINSTEFRDDFSKGFLHSNSSSGSKYTKDNLYGIITNILINRTTQISNTIRNQAFDLANQTMGVLIEKMWDNIEIGFNWKANSDWSIPGQPEKFKYLDVNALGIIALLDYWMETNETIYMNNATLVFDKMDSLWNSAEGAYMNCTGAPNWVAPSNTWDQRIDLEGNAIMMSACLKLFEVTGDISYYNRAFSIFNYCESTFYDDANNAYNWTTYPAVERNDNKNFYGNLLLTEAYIYALEIYNSAELTANFNVSDSIPDYIFNQELMNITCTYTYSSLTNTTYITNASITYKIRYPNSTIIEEFNEYFYDGNTSHSLIYNITDALPIGVNYSVIIYVNTSMFCYLETIKYFNVISGLVNKPIEGMSSTTLYQGPTLNVTIPINNTRHNNVTLDVSMSGANINNESVEDVIFLSLNDTRVYFNLTTKTNAVLGDDIITFRFTKDSVLYLEVNISITIGFSFDYTSPIYEGKVVSGDLVNINLNIINFLPNDQQIVNVSFSGTSLVNNPQIEEVALDPQETKAVYYSVNVSGSGSIQIVMDIMKQDTIYYSETLTIEIVDKFEIISTSFPSTVPQWNYACLIIKLKNNKDEAEDFTLTINGVAASTNINKLASGENRITSAILSTLNPYEFGTKIYNIVLRDSSGEIIVSYYYELTLELSPLALFLCYILPITIPIAIVLYYKNQDIKNKLLRR